MAKPPLVFISYSRKDSDALQDLLTHLQPFVDEGRLQIWYDQRIDPGDPADSEIQEQIDKADICLLLISPSFLASSYIRQREVPTMLALEDVKRTKLVPFFIRPSAAEDGKVTFRTQSGEARPITNWQGLNNPKDHLPRTGNARDTALKTAVLQLLRLAGPNDGMTNPPPSPLPTTDEQVDTNRRTKRPTTPRQIVNDQQPPNQSNARENVRKAPATPVVKRVEPTRSQRQANGEITIRLMANGTTLQREFLGPSGLILPVSTSEVPELLRHTNAAWPGHRLFDALFGSEQDCGKLLSIVTARKNASPTSDGARVRIATRQTQLLSQPWHNTAIGKRSLRESGWTFEFVPFFAGAVSQKYPTLRLDLPCHFLAVIPHAQLRTLAAAHISQVLAIAQRASPSVAQLRVASTWGELEELSRHHPAILYYHGRLVTSPTASLEFETARMLVDLRRLWQKWRPKIAYFNLIDPPADAEAALSELASATDLLIVQGGSLGDLSSPSGQNPHRKAERVIQHLLHEPSPDPIAIAVDAGPGIAMFASYSKFSRTLSTEDPWIPPEQALNREDQRAQGFARCDALRREPESRVVLLFAYGTSGNHLELLGTQILDRLLIFKTSRKPIRLRPDNDEGRLTRDSIVNDVCKQLGLTHGSTLGGALANLTRELPKAPDRGPTLLLIDFGAHGGAAKDRGQALKREDLRELVVALCDSIAPECPQNLRIACIIAAEVPEDRLDVAGRIGNGLQDFRSTQQFTCNLLKPVDRVTQTDLSRYLNKRGSRCPSVLAARFARAVFIKSAGVFEEAVRLLHEAHACGWSPTILAHFETNLPASLGDATAEEDL